MSDEAKNIIFKEALKRRKDEKVFLEYKTKSLKAHLKSADKSNARYCAVIGENELQNGVIWVKDLETKEETFIKTGE
jgi:histidyl-tRNA synthetase